MKPLKKGIVQSKTQVSPVPNGYLEFPDNVPLGPLIHSVPVPRILGAPQGEACTITAETRVSVSTHVGSSTYTNAKANLMVHVTYE